VSTASFAAAFIASVKSGAPCDVAMMEDPAEQARKKEKAAANNADVWEKTYKSCEAAIAVREAALERARLAVDNARGDVIRNASAAVHGLLAGLDKLQAEVFDRRLQLHFFARNDLVPESNKASVAAALEQKTLPGDGKAIFRDEWHSRPLYLAWMNAFEALKRDADAPLPS
jgi:hypothetical protein